MIAGLTGSNTIGVTQLRRSETVEPKFERVVPPLVDRVHAPFCEHEYTLFWFVGSIRFVVPSPPPIELNAVPLQLRSEPLSCAPPLTRPGSCRDTATV